MRKRQRLFAAGLILGISLIGILLKPYMADWLLFVPQKRQPINLIASRILIVAPHPDDETLGGAGVIMNALKQGKKIKVVIVTCGDGYKSAVKKNYNIQRPGPKDYLRLGEDRYLESVRAMEELGVRKEDIIFLGYPDGGINGLWETNWDYSNLHVGLNGKRHSPYAFSFEKGAPYCGANFVKNLSTIIRDYKPTEIVYPDPNDEHHDHWATNAFVQYVLAKQKRHIKEFTYLVHRGDFPFPWELDVDLPLNPPYALRNLGINWAYPLLEDRDKKLAAVYCYKTQIKGIKPFLEAFVRKNELLGIYKELVLPVRANSIEKTKDTSPGVIFLDAKGDTLKRELEANGDITAVRAERIDHNLSLGLTTRSSISKQVRYFVRMRVFKTDGIQRLDLVLFRSRLTAIKLAGNSLSLPRQAQWYVKGNQLWIALPKNIVEGANAILLSADTSRKGKWIDKTAWRLIRIPNMVPR